VATFNMLEQWADDEILCNIIVQCMHTVVTVCGIKIMHDQIMHDQKRARSVPPAARRQLPESRGGSARPGEMVHPQL
jgi:hypothetical protein